MSLIEGYSKFREQWWFLETCSCLKGVLRGCGDYCCYKLGFEEEFDHELYMLISCVFKEEILCDSVAEMGSSFSPWKQHMGLGCLMKFDDDEFLFQDLGMFLNLRKNYYQ